jgi:hypothetical protein
VWQTVLLRGSGGAQFIFMSEIGGSGGRAGRGEWNGRKASGVGGHCRMHQAASAGNSYVHSQLQAQPITVTSKCS